MMINGFRRAALHLYGLSVSDRNWVLEQLPTEQRLRLESLLGELYDMGIPADQQWFAEMVPDVDDVRLAEADDDPLLQAELEIEAADFSLLQQVLDAESDTVVTLLLGYRDWSWRAAYFRSCEPQRRQRISSQQSQGAKQISIRVMQALIWALVEKINNPVTQTGVWQHLTRSSMNTPAGKDGFWRMLWQR